MDKEEESCYEEKEFFNILHDEWMKDTSFDLPKEWEDDDGHEVVQKLHEESSKEPDVHKEQ